LKNILFIGDIHGDTKTWERLITEKEYDLTIQIGDFGAGFVPIPEQYDLKHKFIRGNHDSPEKCKESPRWIPDGTFYPEYKMYFVGGAYSIDKNYRTPFLDWWPDEECSYEELTFFINDYIEKRPLIMVTHDFPHSVAQKMFRGMGGYPITSTRTSYALDVMLSSHKPKYWFGGHWHEEKNMIIDGTHFVCADINQGVELTLN
jgi:Icc-related predicted phosphoesterase